MPMEGPVKFCSPQNAAGVSKEKGVAVMPQTMEVNGDQDLNVTENIIKP